MRLFWTAFGFQLRLAVRAPDSLQVCLTAPLFTVIFLAIIEHAGRPDLAPYAVVAPTLMSVWTMALLSAGQLITEERNQGTLEGLIAAPARLSTVLAGRLSAVTCLSLLSFVESWLVAGALFHRWIAVVHPLPLLAVLLASAVAMAATAGIMSPLFVLVPSARIIQNTVSYPFYLLGGVLVPVSLLPGWIQPLSRLIFLSWCADLIRDCLHRGAIPHLVARLAIVAVLAAASYVVAQLLLNRVLRRVRQLGTLSQI